MKVLHSVVICQTAEMVYQTSQALASMLFHTDTKAISYIGINMIKLVYAIFLKFWMLV